MFKERSLLEIFLKEGMNYELLGIGNGSTWAKA